MRAGIFEAWKALRNRGISSDELRETRNRKLRVLVRHAVERVPYYRSLFGEAGLSPGDISTIDDLASIPVTQKEDLRNAGFDRTVARGADLSTCRKNRTSGSMARPFETWLSGSEQLRRRMLGFRDLLGIGYRPWDRVCAFRSASRLPGYRYRTKTVAPNLPAEQQIRILETMRPTIIKAWPSMLRVLLHQTDDLLGEFVRPRAVITSGEVCEPLLRDRVKASTGAEMFIFYASGEFGPIAAECRAHNGLHLNADQLILECMKGGEPVEPGERGTVVITSLSNYVMPFIRYQLGDITAISEKPCSCGSHFPLIEPPVGRAEEVIRLPDGRIISVMAITAPFLKKFENIEQYRLIQETPWRFVFQMALRGRLKDDALSRIASHIGGSLGASASLELQVVDFIAEEPGIKYRRFISRVNQGD